MSLLLSALDGRVSLRGLLGAGGMGEVHRAWDAALERPVAVKFVRGNDPAEADRLLLEARLQARVEHPHVVRVHDTGTLEGRPCIVLQLVEGRTFADLGPGADWRIKTLLAAQAARGLAAAHRTGLVHRDVKPANVLVEDTDEGPMARLSDFGLARDEEGGLTRSGLLVGSVDFMAPEQILGGAPVDFRADLYGLGATLYAVLAGRPPFRGSAPPTAEAPSTQRSDLTPDGVTPLPGDLLRRALEEEPRPLSTLLPGLPPDLGVVIAQAMEKHPSRRYATADALADDLERVLRGEPVLARRIGAGERTLRWIRRNPVASRALGVGVVAVLAGILGSAWVLVKARERSQIAAELSAEATRVGSLMRMAKLMPFHSLLHERQRVQQATERVKARMATQGPAAQGPGNYVLGLAERVSGHLPSAEKRLRLAWESGFRSEGIRVELADVLLQRYYTELKRVEQIHEGSRKQKRLAELEQTYRAPVKALLQDLSPGGGLAALLRARAALVERHHAEAMEQAKAALAEDGTRYEALHVEGLVAFDQGDRLMKAGQPRDAIPMFEKAGEAYGQAMRFGRSDPDLWRDDGLRYTSTAQAQTWLGLPCEAAFRSAEDAFRKSLELDDQNPETWRVLGGLQLLRAHYRYSGGGDAEPEVSQALKSLDRAEQLDPGAAATQARLAGAKELRGAVLRQAGRDGLPSMLEAVAHLRRAVALEPEQESHREALVNTLGTSLDFLVSKPEEGQAMAEEMVSAARWMADAFPERPSSEIALVVALLNTITFGPDAPDHRPAIYQEARTRFERAASMAKDNLMLQSDLALAAGTAAETAAGKADSVEPWASWTLDHARTLLKGRPADPMGLYSLVRGWRVKAEAEGLSPEVWSQALKEAGTAAELAVARGLLPREVGFEYARLISLGWTKGTPGAGETVTLRWVRLGRKAFPGDLPLAQREAALLHKPVPQPGH